MKKKENSPNAELILVLGDFHIPHRTQEIPEAIKKVLDSKAGKFQHIFSTGNIGNKQTLDWIRTLCQNNNNIHIVKGDNYLSSNEEKNLNETITVKIGEFIISLINGYQIVPWNDIQSLSTLQKQLGSDLLISGYTHQASCLNYEGKYYINPGTVTNTFSPLINDPSPSFMILVISYEYADIYLYELNQLTKELEISKIDITKNKMD